jgi:iron complex transport system substrate-binding protein
VFGAVTGIGCGAAPDASETVPRRIVAIAPNIVEILYELDLGERIVGVGNYCRWPTEVAGKPRIGGLLDPRLEQIVALEPDLAILLPSERSLAQSLESLGVEVLTTPTESIGDIEQAAEVIGRRTGTDQRARELIDRLRDRIAPRGQELGLDVLVIVGREPGNLTDVYAAAGGTFLNELLGRLGAVNAVVDSAVRYPRVGLEAILSRAPSAVIELQPERLTDTVRSRLIDDWRVAMPQATPCVTVIEGDHVLVPGPRLSLLYEQMAAGLATCGASGG